MRRMLIVLLLVVTGAMVALAQGSSSGRLEVQDMSNGLDSLIQKQRKSNENQTTLDGFRIQIYSGSGVSAKAEAQAAEKKFSEMYPKEKVYVIYNAPFWRVRVGDFRYRSEAMGLLKRLSVVFTGSYMVRDNTVKKKTFRKNAQ